MGLSDLKWGTDGAKGVFIAFAAVAVWSAVPLTFRLFLTLKKHNTLYFWAILATSWGLCIREIGYFLQFLLPSTPWLLSMILAQGGWVFMVSGFACVLYSRLNLILQSRKLRRCVLALIIFNGTVWHPTMVTLSIGMVALGHEKPMNRAVLANWQLVFKYLERVQLVMFTAQEILISGFYVRCAYQYLRGRFAKPKTIRQAMYQLLLAQFVVVAMDIAVVVINFIGLQTLKLFIYSFVYCVKLELEFLVLNQLLELAQLGIPGLPSISLKSIRLPEPNERAGDLEAGNIAAGAAQPQLDSGSIKKSAWTSAIPTLPSPSQPSDQDDNSFSDYYASTLRSGRQSLAARTSSGLDLIPEDDITRQNTRPLPSPKIPHI